MKDTKYAIIYRCKICGREETLYIKKDKNNILGDRISDIFVDEENSIIPSNPISIPPNLQNITMTKRHVCYDKLYRYIDTKSFIYESPVFEAIKILEIKEEN